MQIESPNRDCDSAKLMIAATSGEPRSIMSFLTTAETRMLMLWSKDQPRSGMGEIDMMSWPGWKTVMERRAAKAAEKPLTPWFHRTCK